MDDEASRLPADSAGLTGLLPGWMRTLQTTCERFLQLLPEPSIFTSATEGSLGKADESPLHRFYKREIVLGRELLSEVVDDLQSLLGVCKGEVKQTNHIRDLIDVINKGEPRQTRFCCITGQCHRSGADSA